MNPNVPMFLKARAQARAVGDVNLERSLDADLQRIGYVEPAAERVTTPSGMETTAVRAPERAVPQVKPNPRESRRKGGRPPLPRCPHGQVTGRCGKCNTAAA